MIGFQSGLKLLLATLFVTVAAGSSVHAKACQSIAAGNEYNSLSVGEIVYADRRGKKRVRIKSINRSKAQICSPKKCYSAKKLYSSRAVAACGQSASAPAPIYAYEEQDEKAEEPREDRKEKPEKAEEPTSNKPIDKE